MIPNIQNAHDPATRNIINAAIDSINAQGKSIQDLVAEGQLTEGQYAELITVINGLIKSGGVSVYDIDKNRGKFDATYFSNDFLRELNNGEINTTNVLPESVTNVELARNAVSIDKTNFIKASSNLANTDDLIQGYMIDEETGEPVSTISGRYLSQFFTIKGGTDYFTYGTRHIGYYDINQNYLGMKTGGGLFTTPENAALLRFATNHPNEVQINEGDNLLTYEPYFRPTLIDEIDVGLSKFMAVENEGWSI